MVRVQDLEGSAEDRDMMSGVYLVIKDGKFLISSTMAVRSTNAMYARTTMGRSAISCSSLASSKNFFENQMLKSESANFLLQR